MLQNLKHIKHSLLACITLSVCCSFVLLSCTKKSPTTLRTSGDSQEKVFVYCLEGSPKVLNPQIDASGTTASATYPIYRMLLDFEVTSTKVIPSLAERWDISEDGLEYTFHLRKGVKFHTTSYFTPTREFNADDVIWSFQRQGDPKHPYHKIGGGIYTYFTSMDMKGMIQRIEKINDHQVKFVLSRPNAPFLANVALWFTSILSKEYADQLMKEGTPEKIDTHPIGTGPFVFVSYQKDAQIKYRAFEGYYGKRGNVQNLIYAITPDASVRLQKLKSNECQVMAYPDVADIEAIKQDPQLEFLEKPGMNLSYLAFNVKKKPFDNKLVRQAINHALNKKSYIQGVYLGHAQVAKNPLPPTIWGYNDRVQDYEHNVEKAKALLKKAGLAKDFEVDLWTLPVSRPYLTNGRKLGEMMQADLAQVGIRVNLVTYDWASYLDKAGRREHTLLQLGWQGDNGDPDNFLYTLLGCEAIEQGTNYAAWCHKPFNDLVVQAQKLALKDKDKLLRERSLLYEKAQEIFHEEAPWVPIAHSLDQRGVRKGISGYEMSAHGVEIFDFVVVKD